MSDRADSNNTDRNVDCEPVGCTYNRNGICILSDCPCMKEADRTVVCSSYS